MGEIDRQHGMGNMVLGIETAHETAQCRKAKRGLLENPESLPMAGSKGRGGR